MTEEKPTTRILMHGLPMVSAEFYEQEREKVRVLREALEYARTRFGDYNIVDFKLMDAALAATKDQGHE